ncbi:peritrophin-44 [Teleopsis dalmanni]|uniref:peritrophin-44 n=1 Tax=Teleopsis dalmanni TaxID=139649 RepID=UPI0018CF1585|nr:peritrophin-44 [Teleopsis dalmanni]
MKALLYTSVQVLVIAVFLFVAFENITVASSDICRLFPTKTVIRDPDSCNQYITCTNLEGTYTKCATSTPFFDKDTGKCVKTLPENSTCGVSCEETVGLFRADPKSCKGYFYCESEETVLYGSCPDKTHFDEDSQKCIYTDSSACNSHQFEYCSIVKDGVNFKMESGGCDEYYTCKSGALQNKTCSKQYFDVLSGKCVDKTLVTCNVHPIPDGACGTVKKPKKNEFISDDATCRGYFFCADKEDGPDENPIWSQCPQDKFFNEKTQSCVDPLTVKCTRDRCDGRTLTFVSSGTKGCRNYLRCKDGVKQSELSCSNLFFDEVKGACVNNIILYESCKS